MNKLFIGSNTMTSDEIVFMTIAAGIGKFLYGEEIPIRLINTETGKFSDELTIATINDCAYKDWVIFSNSLELHKIEYKSHSVTNVSTRNMSDVKELMNKLFFNVFPDIKISPEIAVVIIQLDIKTIMQMAKAYLALMIDSSHIKHTTKDFVSAILNIISIYMTKFFDERKALLYDLKYMREHTSKVFVVKDVNEYYADFAHHPLYVVEAPKHSSNSIEFYFQHLEELIPEIIHGVIVSIVGNNELVVIRTANNAIEGALTTNFVGIHSSKYLSSKNIICVTTWPGHTASIQAQFAMCAAFSEYAQKKYPAGDVIISPVKYSDAGSISRVIEDLCKQQ